MSIMINDLVETPSDSAFMKRGGAKSKYLSQLPEAEGASGWFHLVSCFFYVNEAVK